MGTSVTTGRGINWRPGFDINIAMTLGPLRRGSADPCQYRTSDGAIWRSSLLASGPVTFRITQLGPREVDCRVWGAGGEEFIEDLPTLLGGGDDPDSFDPRHPLLIDAVRRYPGLRIARTNRVLEAIVPAILEQKVTGKEAFGSWRKLVMTHGTPAPGPVPRPLFTPPSLRAWKLVPSWDWHLAGVDPQRSATIVRTLSRVESLERVGRAAAVGELGPVKQALLGVPGIGAWTVAELAQRAWGDADALSVGDYHLAAFVGWSLLGQKINDEQMVRLLAPWIGHRYRLVRLLELHPGAIKPRFGPRITIQDHRRH